MKGSTLGIPNSIATILLIDAMIIGLYSVGVLKTNQRLVGAKVLGTSALVGLALVA